MAHLDTKIDDGDIVHHRVSGDLTVGELVEMVVYYNKSPHKKTIWELSGVNPINFKPGAMLHGIETAARHIRRNPGRKTARLGTTSVSFGTARMLLTWSVEAAPEIDFQAFDDLVKALNWLNDEDAAVQK